MGSPGTCLRSSSFANLLTEMRGKVLQHDMMYDISLHNSRGEHYHQEGPPDCCIGRLFSRSGQIQGVDMHSLSSLCCDSLTFPDFFSATQGW